VQTGVVTETSETIGEMKKTLGPILLGSLLAGCSSLSVEPSKMGAENDCAQYSAHLSQYNDCMERVDANFRAYEQQRDNPE